MVTPRIYQNECLRTLASVRKKGLDRALVVMASGLGKTITAALDVKRWLRTHPTARVLYLCHQNDILEQARQEFAHVLERHDNRWYAFFNGRDRRRAHDASVVFASFQTMREWRTAFGPEEFGYIVVDESHHTQAPTYRPTLAYFSPRFLLGITATPDRMDFQDIRKIYGHEIYNLPLEAALMRGLLTRVDYRLITDELSDPDILDKPISRLSIEELNRTLFIPKRDEEIVRLIRDYQAMMPQPRTMIFCRTIRHCDRLAHMMPGAMAIHTGLHTTEQLRRLESFREGHTQCALTVDKFNEGIDVPDANVIVFLRSTTSETVFLQQLGRGLRKTRGKRKVFVLDFVGNCQRLEMVHRLWSRATKAGLDAENDQSFIEVKIGRVSFTEVALRVLNVLRAIRTGYTREMLIQQLQRMALELHRPPRYTDIVEYSRKGKCASEATFKAFFGSTNNALRAAGLSTGREPRYTEADLLRQLRELADELGRTPKQGEVQAASKAGRIDSCGIKFASVHAYESVFGSWQAPIDAIGLESTRRVLKVKAELIRQLQAVARRLGHAPTVSEWAEASKAGECAHLATYVAHFDSRMNALKEAGLMGKNKMGCTEEELVSQLQDLARCLGRTPTRRDVDQASKAGKCASSQTFVRQFGSLLAALKAAGLFVNRVGYYSNDELIQQLKALKESLGRVPSASDVEAAAKDGKCVSMGVIRHKRHFGSFAAFLAAAGYADRAAPKGVLVREIRELAQRLGRSPTVADVTQAYKKREVSRHPSTLITRLGGSWPAVMQGASLSASRKVYDKSTLLEQFQRLAQHLGRTPTRRDVDQASKAGKCASSPTFLSNFVTWPELVRQAGLKLSRGSSA